MAGTPNSIITPGIYGQHEITESAPGYFHAIINNEEVDMLLVPFPSEKRLNEVYLNETDDETQKAASYGEKMSALFSSLKEHFHKDSIHLIASHLFVMDSIEDGSERSIQLGGSYMSEEISFLRQQTISPLDTSINHRRFPAVQMQDTAALHFLLILRKLLFINRLSP